jgi:hypothetical protein
MSLAFMLWRLAFRSLLAIRGVSTSVGPSLWCRCCCICAALRAAYQAAETAPAGGNGSNPRGQIRRAHCHGYWSGPLKDDRGDPVPSTKRHFDLRWQLPVAANLGAVEGMPSVFRPVK